MLSLTLSAACEAPPPLTAENSLGKSQKILELADPPLNSVCSTPPAHCDFDRESVPSISLEVLCSGEDLSLLTYKLNETLVFDSETCPLLDGEGITLIAPEGKRHFNINGSATLQNITLACGQNTDPESTGGSILASGTSEQNLTLYNVQFYGNISYGDGGALASDGLNLGSHYSCFDNNKALRGGAVYIQNAQSAILENTDLNDNTNPGCGDGIVDDVDGPFGDFDEECDDGNRVNESCIDGTHTFCNASCQIVTTYCGCGDGVIDTNEGEVCDDGNGDDGDGCSASCGVEDGWSCNGAPSVCETNAPKTQPIYHYYSLNDENNLQINEEQRLDGYDFIGISFNVFKRRGDTLRPLYSCLNIDSQKGALGGDTFLSLDPNCENQGAGPSVYTEPYPSAETSRLGFIYTNEEEETCPLYRCYNSITNDHITTGDPNMDCHLLDDAGWVVAPAWGNQWPGIWGYVPKTIPGEACPAPPILDACPGDPNKTEPGICGCGVADANDRTWYLDQDFDYLGDPAISKDACTQPFETGSIVSPIGLGTSWTIPYVPNNNDSCPNDAQNDADGDGVCGDVDACPNDADKIEPITWCADLDKDGDGAANSAITACSKPDGSQYGQRRGGRRRPRPSAAGLSLSVTYVENCTDVCPNDPNKTTDAGACGCRFADTDSDGDGLADCIDDEPDCATNNTDICGVCGGPGFNTTCDTDHDGVYDHEDNCMLLPNGPNGATEECHDQEDADDDGYGNACDLDFNNDNGVGADDMGAFLSNTDQTNLVMDSNCDGAVGADDLGNVLNALGSLPGVSGLYAQHSCSCPEPLSYGCTEPNADNYDSQADLDDGSCYVEGCMDSEASNYNAEATRDNDSCCEDWEIFIPEENGGPGNCYEVELAYLNITGDPVGQGGPYRTDLSSPYGWGADYGSPWAYGQAIRVGQSGGFMDTGNGWSRIEVGGNNESNENIGSVFSDPIARQLLRRNHPAYWPKDDTPGGVYGSVETPNSSYHTLGRLGFGLPLPTHFHWVGTFGTMNHRTGPFFQESAGSDIDMFEQSGDSQYLGSRVAQLSSTILDDPRNDQSHGATTHWNHVHHAIYYIKYCDAGEYYTPENTWTESYPDIQHPGVCCPSGQIYIPADMPGITPEFLDALNAGGDDDNDDDACYPFNFSFGGSEGSWGNWLGSDFPFG